MVRLIEVIPYKPEWTAQYNEEATKIADILDHELIEIHHIGSTAIKGICAKPIIDILIVVRSIPYIDKLNERMIGIGYRPMGEYGIKGRRFFIKGHDELRTHHLHAFQLGDGQIKKYLYFRDYLIANPNVAKHYSDLKIELAGKYPHNIDKYMDGKDGFISNINASFGGLAKPKR
jgi:GrpB-like predicted nucleotidyltransferase (UPF0157 family)